MSEHNERQPDRGVNIRSQISIHASIIVIFVPLSLVGMIVFLVYIGYHWHTFIGQTASIFSWLLFFGGLCLWVGLSWCFTKVLKSGVEVFTLFGQGLVQIYHKWAEARTVVARNQLLHTDSNYVVHLDRGKVVVTPIAQEKYNYSIRQQDDRKQLPPPHEKREENDDREDEEELSTLPTLVRYSDVRALVPSGHALVGISEHGIETRDRSIRALVLVVGGSGTGKTNSVSIRVDEDYQAGHKFLVIDHHAFKDDSLANAIKGCSSQFLMPIAKTTEDTIKVLDRFMEIYERRKDGEPCYPPITLLVDEVGSMTSYVETDEEKELVRKLKEVARLCGQETRGFNMCGIFINQNMIGIAWLRRYAIMVLAHQVTMWNERIIVCNQDRTIARDMDKWPKGRTLVYGIAFEEGPQIYQQPVFSPSRVVDSAPITRIEPLQPAPTSKQVEPAPTTSDIDIEDAYVAWNNGANSVAKLEQKLGLTHHKAYSMYKEMKSQGYIS
jgi:hypothetical protein